MNVLISGATGLVGTALSALLKQDGHTIFRLTRTKREPNDIAWEPLSGKLDLSSAPAFDGVVHLAGENIAGRWTASKKKAIEDSRNLGTRTLCEALARLPQRPQRLVSASAVGFYGRRGDETLTESSAAGTGFLPDVCKIWEAATRPAEDAGISVVHSRLGVVLSPKGGALGKMLLPFKMGVGGVIGSGTQYMSWVTLDDVAAALAFLRVHPELTGAVNLVAPNPVTNYTFTKALGKVLHRPTIFPMPAFAARLAFGEMADDLLLGSARVLPERLQQAGYAFKHTDIESGLRAVLT
jgi:uncharacterized protein (TIGR01777 family)